MTPKEITTLAGHRLLQPWVMKLVMDAVDHERESCAKLCEDMIASVITKPMPLRDIVEAIRARSNTRSKK